MTMPCGNTQAEIDRDTDTEHAERTRYENQEAQYVYVLNQLLSGKKVYTFSASFNLSQILEGKHDEFADLVNQDVDFMLEYRNGRLDKGLRTLIENEAHRLAGNIVG